MKKLAKKLPIPLPFSLTSLSINSYESRIEPSSSLESVPLRVDTRGPHTSLAIDMHVLRPADTPTGERVSLEERGEKRDERGLVKKMGSESRGEENLPGSWLLRVALKFTRDVLGIPLGLMILTSPNTERLAMRRG